MRKRDKSLRRSALWTGPGVPERNFSKLRKRKTRVRKVHPERTVGILYRSASPSDPTGANRKRIYRPGVRMDIAALKKEHKYEQTRPKTYVGRKIFCGSGVIGKNRGKY